MLNPKNNVCKLRNGVLESLFVCFQDGRQNHIESYISSGSSMFVKEVVEGFLSANC